MVSAGHPPSGGSVGGRLGLDIILNYALNEVSLFLLVAVVSIQLGPRQTKQRSEQIGRRSLALTSVETWSVVIIFCHNVSEFTSSLGGMCYPKVRSTI